MTKKYSHYAVSFILQTPEKSIKKLFMHPFSNALKKGAQLDQKNLAYIRRWRWGIIFLFALLTTLYIEKPSISMLVLVLMFGIGSIIFPITLLGHRYRDEIDVGTVVAFDLNTAKSGGTWGALGLVVWSIYKAFWGA